MSKSDDEGGREFTDLDAIQGEWIANDVERKAHEEVEHFRHAHSKDPIDGIMNTIFGTAEECIDPRCRSEEQYAEVKAEEEATRHSESWWERWSRSREEERLISELEAERDSDDCESWWERWFRGSNNGGDGEGGSD